MLVVGGSRHERNKETMHLLPQILPPRSPIGKVPEGLFKTRLPAQTQTRSSKEVPQRKPRLFSRPLWADQEMVGSPPRLFGQLPCDTPKTYGPKTLAGSPAATPNQVDLRGYTSHDAPTESPGSVGSARRGYTSHDPAPVRRTLDRSGRETARGYTSSECFFGRGPVKCRHGLRTLGKHPPSSLKRAPV